MTTNTRIGSITFFRDSGRETALIKPSDRRALVVAAILALVPVLSVIVSPDRGVPLLATIGCGAVAAVVFAWQLLGRTRIDAGRDSVVVRKSILGVGFWSVTVPVASITFVQLEKQQMRGKGGSYDTYCVTFGSGQDEIVRLSVEPADGAALVAMLQRTRDG